MALHLVAWKGRFGIVKALLAKDAVLDGVDFQWDMYSVGGQLEIGVELKEEGAIMDRPQSPTTITQSPTNADSTKVTTRACI